MVALQVQGFCLILAIFPAPIIPRIGFYGLKYKAFSIIQDTLLKRLAKTLSGQDRDIMESILRDFALKNEDGM